MTFLLVDADALPVLTAVGGWIVGIFSTLFVQRLRATSGRARELHKLITELRTGNYATERLKRARDIRNLIGAPSPSSRKAHRAGIGDLAANGGCREQARPKRLRQAGARRGKGALEKQADAEIAILLPRLKRRAK